MVESRDEGQGPDGTVETGAMQEGAAVSPTLAGSTAQRDGVQTLSAESIASGSLDLLVQLGEAGLLAKLLKDIADQQHGPMWATVSAFAQKMIEAHDKHNETPPYKAT